MEKEIQKIKSAETLAPCVTLKRDIGKFEGGSVFRLVGDHYVCGNLKLEADHIILRKDLFER